MSQINWLEKYKENFQQIKNKMIELDLWSDTPPSEKAMQSTMPFAVDTMPFENWLQFIFLEKMWQIINNGQLPPGPASISPIAKEVYKEQSECIPLIKLLDQFDEISHLSHLH